VSASLGMNQTTAGREGTKLYLLPHRHETAGNGGLGLWGWWYGGVVWEMAGQWPKVGVHAVKFPHASGLVLSCDIQSASRHCKYTN
jgi:hypothetical protein